MAVCPAGSPVSLGDATDVELSEVDDDMLEVEDSRTAHGQLNKGVEQPGFNLTWLCPTLQTKGFELRVREKSF